MDGQICTIEIKNGDEEVIKFVKKFNLKENLSDIRKKLGNKISDDIIFTLPDGTDIIKEDENEFILNDIVDKCLIHMKTIKKNKTKIKYELYINGNYGNYKLDALKVESKRLNDIRNIINDYIAEKGVFLSKRRKKNIN